MFHNPNIILCGYQSVRINEVWLSPSRDVSVSPPRHRTMREAQARDWSMSHFWDLWLLFDRWLVVGGGFRPVSMWCTPQQRAVASTLYIYISTEEVRLCLSLALIRGEAQHTAGHRVRLTHIRRTPSSCVCRAYTCGVGVGCRCILYVGAA